MNSLERFLELFHASFVSTHLNRWAFSFIFERKKYIKAEKERIIVEATQTVSFRDPS